MAHVKIYQLCLQSLMEIFTADGDLEDQDHLKYVILKIKIRSPKQRPLEDQDQITILISRSRSCSSLRMGQGNKLTAKC